MVDPLRAAPVASTTAAVPTTSASPGMSASREPYSSGGVSKPASSDSPLTKLLAAAMEPLQREIKRLRARVSAVEAVRVAN